MIRLKVKEIAISKRISQRQLVLRSGLDIKSVQQILRNDRSNILLSTLDRLAIGLGVNPCELIEQVPDKEEG